MSPNDFFLKKKLWILVNYNFYYVLKIELWKEFIELTLFILNLHAIIKAKWWYFTNARFEILGCKLTNANPRSMIQMNSK